MEKIQKSGDEIMKNEVLIEDMVLLLKEVTTLTSVMFENPSLIALIHETLAKVQEKGA